MGFLKSLCDVIDLQLFLLLGLTLSEAPLYTVFATYSTYLEVGRRQGKIMFTLILIVTSMSWVHFIFRLFLRMKQTEEEKYMTNTCAVFCSI